MGRKRTVDEALPRYLHRQGKCALTGIPFNLESPEGATLRPWAPSLDRIDSSKGYTAKNCRLVCVAVNFALNQWGEAVFRKIATAIASQNQGLM